MNVRQRIIATITFLGGLYFVLEFLLPPELVGFDIGARHEEVTNGFLIVGTMAIGLGLINILSVHGRRVLYLRSGSFDSCALLGGLFFMAIVSGADWWSGVHREGELLALRRARLFAERIVEDRKQNASTLPYTERVELLLRDSEATTQAELRRLDSLSLVESRASTPFSDFADRSRRLIGETRERFDAMSQTLAGVKALSPRFDESERELLKFSSAVGAYEGSLRDLLAHLGTVSLTSRLSTLLFDGLFVPLGSAMFALLGFYIAAASYRAFRIQSIESGLMMVAALVVILGQIPFGLYLASWLPELRLWLMEVPNAAAFRAIKFGASIAFLGMAVRMWLSIESDSFSHSVSQKSAGREG